jgi:stage II sporulation protein GA (sporulation sigma-E factor processing peptidase)
LEVLEDSTSRVRRFFFMGFFIIGKDSIGRGDDMTTIYLDLYIMKNFCMDYLLLHLVGRVMKLEKRRGRLLLSAAIGSVSATVPVLWIWRCGNMPGAIGIVLWYGIGLLMERVAYPITKGRQLHQAFMMMSTGAILLYGVVAWLEQQGLQFSLIQYAMAVVIVHIVCDLTLNQYHKRKRVVNFSIKIGNNRIDQKALYDTGNELKDPLSGLFVVVGAYKAFSGYLPMEYQKVFEAFFQNPTPDYNRMAEKGWKDIYWIPYQTVGHGREYLMGIRCENLWIESDSGKKACGKVILALVNQEFSNESEYTLILHNNMLH